ncbi:MAG: hypothetical protein LUQ38_12525 [Methanotrichaceae archaeon]|nr:hypothetical protein [Methanotrichaceae archaeon]
MFDTLSKSYSALDLSQMAPATAAFRFHLNIHLDKEDTHLCRIFKERVSLPEQRGGWCHVQGGSSGAVS